MAELVYSALCSLDGFVADRDGSFDWAAPDEEVHGFVNELQRGLGTHLYGRRMYEVMQVWETFPDLPDPAGVLTDYAGIWRAADKVVYSTTLPQVSSSRTRLVPRFVADEVMALKASASADLGIGGPTLAAEAIRAGLVEEYQLFLSPVVVGGGTPALPAEVRLDLRLVEEQRFTSGVVFVRYRLR